MSKLIIFAPNTGGNHIANIIGAGQNSDNCIKDKPLLQRYLNDHRYLNEICDSGHHFNSLFLHDQPSIKENCIYIGHLDQVLLQSNKNKIKDIKDILIITIQGYANKKLRGIYTLSDLEQAVYTKEFLQNIFRNKNLYTLNFDDMLSNFDILKFVLDDTPFSIKSKYKEYHKIWLENIKTIKNKDGILLKQEVVT